MADAGASEGKFDLVVIGGGSSGLATCKEAGRLGARVALVEMAELGGTCVNRGCVPKKLLWKAAKTVQQADDMVGLGLLSTAPVFDLAAHQRHVSAKLASIHDSFEAQLADAGVTLLRGRASVGTDGTVSVDGQTLGTRRVVLATGAAPIMLDIDGADLMCDSSDVLSWEHVPARIAIIGAGYIGCEFASIFTALGAKVSIVNDTPNLLDGFDRDAVTVVETVFERRGIERFMEREPASISRAGDDLVLTLDDGHTIVCDAVVCAVGRAPKLDGLGPIGGVLKTTEKGFVAIDDCFRTSIAGVHAVGDLVDRMPLTPVAVRDGRTLARLLYAPEADPQRLDLGHAATAAFTIPPMAQVGRVRDGDADPQGCRVASGHVAPIQSGVLLPEDQGEDANFHKLLTDEDRIVGAALVSDDAPDTIAGLAAMVAGGVTTEAVHDPAAIHPSFAEEFIGSN